MQKRYVFHRIFFAALLFAPFLFSCKKSLQDTKEDIVMAAIITGRWYVSEYTVNTTDVTSEFAGYEFQFHGNGSVDGINGSTTITGTWAGDSNNFTIISSFPGSAGHPLTRLNGVWKWTDSDWTYVKSYYVSGADTWYLTLRKK
ncbi:MAG TPA: hypothetical protein VEB42_09905 [Chitinophagaceae bacterium]|nr:hypothetical protein [Chitinophagaceae bacterium]